MEDPALYTELPLSLLSTSVLIRSHTARFQPYHRLHQPQLFPNIRHHDFHSLHRNLERVNHEEEEQVSPVDQGKPHISCLYPEILAIIFSYLEVRDKGRVAQVCTSWRDASYHKSVWRGVEAKLHLRRANPSLFASLVKRGIKRVQVLSLRRSLRDVIQGIPNLESLNLSGCYNVADVGISHALVTEVSSLSELNLSLCKQVTDNSLSRIAQHLKNLEVLELGGCSNITNTGLVLIAWGLKKLKRLNLRSCWHVSDQGIGHLALGNQSLEHLGLQDCQRLSDEALKHATGLTSLKSLNLSFCISITDSGLKHIAKMTNLRELNLRSCDNISDIGMAYLAEGGSRITSLDVSFCDKIGDQALVHISQGLFNLKSLSLSACQISDEGLGKISSTLHDLETLNIGQCYRITDSGISTLAESLTRLRYIDLYGCTKITTVGLARVMKLPNLSILNLGSLPRENVLTLPENLTYLNMRGPVFYTLENSVEKEWTGYRIYEHKVFRETDEDGHTHRTPVRVPYLKHVFSSESIYPEMYSDAGKHYLLYCRFRLLKLCAFSSALKRLFHKKFGPLTTYAEMYRRGCSDLS